MSDPSVRVPGFVAWIREFLEGEIRDKKERLHKVGRAFDGKLPPERLESFHSLVDAGEEGVALEGLCSNLDDFDVAVPGDVYDEIVFFSRDMGLDPDYWMRLRRDDPAP